MVVHDDRGVGARSVQLGVQEHGGGHVPSAVDDLAVGVEAQDVGGPHLLPPDPPRVAPHAAVVGRDGDVTREVLAPALAGQDAQRARQLLAHGQIVTDAGSGSGQAHGHDGIRETLWLVKVLVIGATGELGREVAAVLAGRERCRPSFARRPHPGWHSWARSSRWSSATCATRRRSRARAPASTRMFLVSSPTQDQVELETNAIEAAERAGVERIVKISNIPIPGLETGLHGNHRAIERRLAASSCAATIVQPSFFTSVIDKQSDVVEGGHVVLPTGAGKIAWIDAVRHRGGRGGSAGARRPRRCRCTSPDPKRSTATRLRPASV